MGTGCSSLATWQHSSPPSSASLKEQRADQANQPEREERLVPPIVTHGEVPLVEAPVFSDAASLQFSNPLAPQHPSSPVPELELRSPLIIVPPSPHQRTTVTNESFSSAARHRRRLRPTVVSSAAQWTSTTERGAMPLMQSSQKSLDIRQWISDSSSFAEDDDGATVSPTTMGGGDAMSMSRQMFSTTTAGDVL